MLLLYNFRESIDSQWEKVNQEVSTVAEGGNLGFERYDVVGINIAYVTNDGF